MGNNNGQNKPIPFPMTARTPIVGQPFTLSSVWMPVHAILTCNCGGSDTKVSIVGSVAGQCQSCKKTYNAAFNPTNGKIEMQIGTPTAEQVIS